MGCVQATTAATKQKTPACAATFAQPFEMLDREVSADDFRAFAGASSRQMPRQPEWYADGTHPVVNVTWSEAEAYCEWAGGRLPTEAEWEHAARGGLDGKLFPWGDEFTGQANGRHNLKTEQFDFTAPVGSFPPNAFGLHDMAGNVWEWTASAFTPTHARQPDGNGYDLRTIKGGGWDNLISRLRVSERAALSRQGRHNLYVGFRCVRLECKIADTMKYQLLGPAVTASALRPVAGIALWISRASFDVAGTTAAPERVAMLPSPAELMGFVVMALLIAAGLAVASSHRRDRQQSFWSAATEALLPLFALGLLLLPYLPWLADWVPGAAAAGRARHVS